MPHHRLKSPNDYYADELEESEGADTELGDTRRAIEHQFDLDKDGLTEDLRRTLALQAHARDYELEQAWDQREVAYRYERTERDRAAIEERYDERVMAAWHEYRAKHAKLVADYHDDLRVLHDRRQQALQAIESGRASWL
jgi:hypothetical protein